VKFCYYEFVNNFFFFQTPADMMLPSLDDKIKSECENFILNYNSSNSVGYYKKKINHNKNWSEDTEVYSKIAKDVFHVLLVQYLIIV